MAKAAGCFRRLFAAQIQTVTVPGRLEGCHDMEIGYCYRTEIYCDELLGAK
jgi:hypothetical protein